MRKTVFFILSFLSAAVTVSAADTLRIREFRYIGPLSVKSPVPFDSLDVKGKAFDPKSLLSAAVNTGALQSRPLEPLDSLRAGEGIHLLGFELSTPKFSKGSITVDGLKNYKLTVDDVETSELKLLPGRHRCVIRVLADTAVQKFTVRVVPDSMGVIATFPSGEGRGEASPRLDFERLWASDLSFGSEISPDGTMYRSSDYHYESDGSGYYTREVKDLRTGETLCDGMYWQWMPKSNLLWRERTRMKNREIVTRDPRTGKESVLADHLPDGKITLSPDESFIIFTIEEEGPSEDPDGYEILNPDDRQPGWRDRNRLALYRFADGLLQPLTHGYRNLTLKDISQDGRMILISQHDMNLPIRDRDVTHRSSTVQSFFTMNLETFGVDTLVFRDGFVSGGMFTRDGTKVVYKGSPDSFGGIGRNVPKGMIANAFDYQLYVQDLSSKQVTALTRDFDPSVEILDLSLYDGKFYFTALNRDSVSFYSLDPDTRQIARIAQPEEVVNTFWLARTSPAFTLIGEGALNQRRVWAGTLPAADSSLSNAQCSKLSDLSSENLAGLDMPTCEGWTFRNRRGMTITTSYFLPPAFDASRKYPMIVYYYGGCVPVSRNFGKNWPFPVWASMDYIVLVVNPRGAAGFGQKYSAWHVNTAGREVADDIIEAVKKFTASHPWVNAQKIGCMGASYGGFMTQYLTTQTDIFACAVSHAGISDHTSYWGEGYWGYSYSEVSMAGSYPWSDRRLYVDQSPLYNADRIHTPLLFTHGTKDTNVPVGESIQLFTALKVLGRETAFIAFDGENHHIADTEKNHRWQLTQMAWFQRWLQDDDTWWFELYPKKDL